VKNFSENVVRHSLAYSIHAKVVRGGSPLMRENVAETGPALSKTTISDQLYITLH